MKDGGGRAADTLTLRDHFAEEATKALMSDSQKVREMERAALHHRATFVQVLAMTAYNVADAMLAERVK